MIPGTCIWALDMSRICSPYSHSIHHGKRHKHHKIIQIDTSRSITHISWTLDISRFSVSHVSYMLHKHIVWYLPDPQHILLILDFLRITQHLAGPRHVHLGSWYIAVCSPPTHSIHYGKRHKPHKSSNATIPDPQHTSRGFSTYYGSEHLISQTHMPDKHIMWYLPDLQHIVWTLDFWTYNTTFNWSPACVFGIPICCAHPQFTLWKTA